MDASVLILAVASLTPNAIFLRSQAAVNALPLPPYIAFTEQDDTIKGRGHERERVRIIVRTSDGRAFVRLLQNANGTPATAQPRVIPDGDYTPVTNIYRIGDFPLASFGLRHEARPGIFEAKGTPQPPPPDGSRVIAEVRTVNVPYRIVDLGDTQLNGRPMYHLGLTPSYDWGHHVLREMWIDKQTFIPARYIAERFVDDGILPFRYMVEVNTATENGHLVNTDADGHFNINRALIIHLTGEGRWTISDVAFPTDPPDWLFDPTAYAQHATQAVPNF